MEKENTFLNADNLYEEVEGEAGKELALEIEPVSYTHPPSPRDRG